MQTVDYIPTPPSSSPLASVRGENGFKDYHNPPLDFSKAPFAEQLSRLISIKLPDPREIEALSERDSSRSRPNDSPIHILTHISSAVDEVLYYFKTARTVLSDLDGEDNVEWIYEGRQAVFDVGSTILCAGDIMNQMMNVLEESKVREEEKREGEYEKQMYSHHSHANRLTHSSLYFPVIDKIELAIKQWHEILDLVRYLRLQVDISTEWKDLYEQILTDVNDEINTCSTTIFEIQEKLHSNLSTDSIDIDNLITAMDESPYMGKIKLPSLSELEREINRNYLEIHSRINPLRASLNFVPIRIEQYSQKAKDIFPSSIITVQKKHLELESRFNQIVKDIDSLQKQLGEERWKSIFRKTGQRAVELLNTLQDNLNIISIEQQKARQGEKIDRIKVDRIATKNGYLMPSIARHISIIDRAVRDKFSVTTEMYTVQSALHRQWNSLLLLAESREDDPEESPSVRGAGSHMHSQSIDLSINTTYSHYSNSSTSLSPLSSPNTSPTPSIRPNRHKPTLSTEINPIRGLAIKFPSHIRKESNVNSNTSSNHSMASSTSSIVSTSSTATNASSIPPPSSPPKEISSTIPLSPPMTTLATQEVLITAELSPPSPIIVKKSNTPSISSPTFSQIAVSKSRNSNVYLKSPKISFQPLPHSVKQSQIPILSPERRPSSRLSLTPSRPSSRLDSRHSLATSYPEQTPSKIPRPSSRLSDIGQISSLKSMQDRRNDSRLSLTPIPSTPSRGRRIASSSITESRLPRPSSRTDNTPSRIISRRVSSAILNQTPRKQPSLDRKVSLPGQLHQFSSIHYRPPSSTGTHSIPSLPARPPWR